MRGGRNEPLSSLLPQERAPGEWLVRPVTGAAATKPYRCPGCDHEIAVGLPHVVAWPYEQPDLRRHWHTPCWRRFGPPRSVA